MIAQFKFAVVLTTLFSLAIGNGISQTKYENDTLYTESGYKIYKGETLTFNAGSRSDGVYRFVKIWRLFVMHRLYSCEILDMGKLETTSLDNVYINLYVNMLLKDSSHVKVSIRLNFDKAINSKDGLPSELKVPDEFKQ